MTSLSNVNQMYIQRALSSSNIQPQPIQSSPAPVISPQPQATFPEEPDTFTPSKKKNHTKTIIGAGALLAAATGLYFLVRSGRLSFTGREQGTGNPITVPDEIIKIKDNVLASVSTIQEKGKSLITQGKNLQTEAGNIQTAAQKEFDEVLEIIKNGAANNFKETNNVRFINRTNKKGEAIGQKFMEEFDGDKILRRALFETNNPEQIICIEKGVEQIPDGKKAAESFHYFEGKLREYVRNIEETETYEKAAEKFRFDRKTDKLETWRKDYFYSDKEHSCGEYIQFFEDGDFIWEKDNKTVKDIISGIETETETIGEHMSLSYDENDMVKGYEKGRERVVEYHKDGTKLTTKSAEKTDETYSFTNNSLSSWIKGFEMDKDGNQKRAYWLFCNEDGTPSSCTVNSTGPNQQEAYYKF